MTKLNSKAFSALKNKVNGQSKGHGVENATEGKKQPKKRNPASVIVQHMEKVCKEYGLEYELEKSITKIRNWRADLFIPSLNILAEAEGIMSETSRHTTITGYTGDCEKYTNAASKGLTVFRYTIISYQQFEADLLRFFYHNQIKVEP